MTDTLRWGSPSFLHQQSVWRRLEFGAGRRGAVALGAVAAAGLAGSVYFGIDHFRHQDNVAAEQAAASRTERANADLQDALARLRDQLGVADQALSMAQGRIDSLSDEAKSKRNEIEKQLAVTEQSATSKTDRIGQLNKALEQAQRELHLAEAQRVTLLARLSKAEADLAERQAQTQAEWQKKLQQLQAERDKATAERDRYRAQLEEKQSMMRQRQAAPAPTVAAVAPPPVAATPAPQPAPAPMAAVAPAPVAAAPALTAAPAPVAPAVAAAPAPAPVVATAAPMPQVIRGYTPAVATAAPAAVATPTGTVAVARGGVAQFERVLASAGVDVTRLFAQYGMRTGEGGPYIPVAHGAAPPVASISPEKLVALSRLVKVLPVTAPLQSYEFGSPFGVRGDPVNGHAAYHTGVDLLAPYMTPIYATAPGVVTFSGYRDDYGKIVEIDHGNGISTRYAHMHRQLVSVGQRVSAHEQIGFLGSSGRATGPHVHYEVLVNGEPQDPQKFMALSHLVPVAAN